MFFVFSLVNIFFQFFEKMTILLQLHKTYILIIPLCQPDFCRILCG